MQEEGGARGQGLKGQMRRSEIRTRRLGDWKQHLWVPMVSLALRQGNTAGEVGRRGCWDILAATSDKDQKKKSQNFLSAASRQKGVLRYQSCNSSNISGLAPSNLSRTGRPEALEVGHPLATAASLSPHPLLHPHPTRGPKHLVPEK